MKTFSSKFAMLAGAAMLVLPSVAAAQDRPAAEAEADAPQDDLVVTGTLQAYRGNVPLEELPQATQVLSSETLQDLNITRLDTALDLSASVARQNAFGGIFDSFAIRGFVGDPNTPSGFLINGFNGARGYGGTRDTSSVEAIEILRGPTSALFGRGEPGGTVNIVTKKPSLADAFGYVSASASRFNTYRGEGDYNMPLGEMLAVRVTGAYEEGDSYRDTVDNKKWVVTPNILFRSGDFTANYELEYQRQDIDFDRGVPAINGNPGVLPRSRFLGEPADGPNRAKNIGQQLQVEQKLGGDWKVLGGVAYRYTQLQGFGEDPEFGASRNPIFVNGAIAGRYLSRRRIFRDYDAKDFIPRGEVSGSVMTGSIKHNVLLGADYEWFKQDIVQTRYRPPTIASLTAAQRAELASGTASAATLRAINAIDIYNPVYTPADQLPVPGAFQSRIEIAKAWGVYLRDRIEVTDWLAIQGGIRYDDYRQTVENRLNLVNTHQKFSKWSPSAGISVKPSDRLTIYGSYSQGFRANTGVNVRNEAFRPETTESFEVGTKFDVIDKTLSGTVALFKMKKSNLLTADPVNAGFTLDVGKAESKGLEIDLNANLPNGLKVVASYAYVDASISEDIADPDFGRTIRAGDPLINIPDHSVTVLVSKDIAIGDHVVTLGGDIKHVSKRLGETGTQYFLPETTLIRAFANADLSDRLSLSADVTNLANVEWYPNSYAALWTMPGAPRTWTARIKYRF